MQLKRAIAAALVWAFAATVWAADADVVNQAEALLRAGRYAEAFKLLEPLEDKLAGDIRYDYLLARSALEIGQPSRASFIYERILALEPNYAGVRLEMGRAYLAMGDYARAKLEFETLLRLPNLPPDLRQQALNYGRLAEDRTSGKRTTFAGYVEYGMGYDSNVQSETSVAPVTDPFGLPIFFGQERSDHYSALSVGGELVHWLTERLSAYAGGDLRGRWYRQIDIGDYATADGRLGLGYTRDGTQTRVGAIFGRYDLDHEPTRNSAGVTGEFRTLVNPRNQLSVNLQLSRFEYIPSSFERSNYDLLQSSVGWLGVVNDGRGAVGISLLGGLEKATEGREDGDKPYAGARLTLQNSFTDTVGAFFLAGAQRGKYKDTNPIFLEKRKDTLYDVAAGITWTFAPGWSLRPQLVYLKNDSNLALFEYEKTDLSINIRADF